MLAYLRAIESDCLLLRGETGMLADEGAVPGFLPRKEACGERLTDLVLPGSHHLHVSKSCGCLKVSCDLVFFCSEVVLFVVDSRQAVGSVTGACMRTD